MAEREFYWVSYRRGPEQVAEFHREPADGGKESATFTGDDARLEGEETFDLSVIERILPPGRVEHAAEKLREVFETRDGDAHWAIVEEALALLGHPKRLCDQD